MSYILKLKCIKFDIGWGSAPDPWGSLQRSPDPLAGFKGPTSKGRGGEGRGRRPEGRGEEGKAEGERRDRGRGGRGMRMGIAHPLFSA